MVLDIEPHATSQDVCVALRWTRVWACKTLRRLEATGLAECTNTTPLTWCLTARGAGYLFGLYESIGFDTTMRI